MNAIPHVRIAPEWGRSTGCTGIRWEKTMHDRSKRIAAGTRVAINEDWFTFGVDIVEFRESNDIREDVTALRERLAEEGYLFFRGFFDRDLVLRARRRVLRHIEKLGCLKPGTD